MQLFKNRHEGVRAMPLGDNRFGAQSLSILELKKSFDPLFKNHKARLTVVHIKPSSFYGSIEPWNAGL
jgi:hypothetical protein